MNRFLFALVNRLREYYVVTQQTLSDDTTRIVVRRAKRVLAVEVSSLWGLSANGYWSWQLMDWDNPSTPVFSAHHRAGEDFDDYLDRVEENIIKVLA